MRSAPRGQAGGLQGQVGEHCLMPVFLFGPEPSWLTATVQAGRGEGEESCELVCVCLGWGVEAEVAAVSGGNSEQRVDLGDWRGVRRVQPPFSPPGEIQPFANRGGYGEILFQGMALT